MSSTPTNPSSRRATRRSHGVTLVAAAATLGVSCGVIDATTTATDQPAPSACDQAGVGADTDTFSLDESGTFSAVAVVDSAREGDRRDTVPVNVLSRDGRLIATTGPFEMSTPAIFDLATGIQFGVAPPPVFDVAGGAQIRVAHDGQHYELVLVRNAPIADNGDGQLIRPPLGSPVSTAIDICSGDGPRSIQLDAVYADPIGRQVFVISSWESTPGVSSAVASSTGPRADGLRAAASPRPRQMPTDTTETGATS